MIVFTLPRLLFLELVEYVLAVSPIRISKSQSQMLTSSMVKIKRNRLGHGFQGIP